MKYSSKKVLGFSALGIVVLGLLGFLYRRFLSPGAMRWTTTLDDPVFHSVCKRFDIEMLEYHSKRPCRITDRQLNQREVFPNFKACEKWALQQRKMLTAKKVSSGKTSQ